MTNAFAEPISPVHITTVSAEARKVRLGKKKNLDDALRDGDLLHSTELISEIAERFSAGEICKFYLTGSVRNILDKNQLASQKRQVAAAVQIAHTQDLSNFDMTKVLFTAIICGIYSGINLSRSYETWSMDISALNRWIKQDQLHPKTVTSSTVTRSVKNVLRQIHRLPGSGSTSTASKVVHDAIYYPLFYGTKEQKMEYMNMFFRQYADDHSFETLLDGENSLVNGFLTQFRTTVRGNIWRTKHMLVKSITENYPQKVLQLVEDFIQYKR